MLHILFSGRKHGRSSYGSMGTRRNKACRLMYTRLLSAYPALLDDLTPALAQRVLDRLDRWHFNAFLLDRLTGGHCLPAACAHIIHKTGHNLHPQKDVRIQGRNVYGNISVILKRSLSSATER